MSLPSSIIVIAAAILALLLIVFPGRGGKSRLLRASLHTTSLVGYAAAGWLLARDGDLRDGLVLLLVGVLWSGVAWIASADRTRRAGRNSQNGENGRAESELRAEDGEDGDALEPHGRIILSRLLAMKESKIGGIATPRDRIVYADCAGGVAGAVEMMRKTGHLRIPMVDGSIDRIVGVLHAKDVVPLAVEGGRVRPLKSLMRRPIFVSTVTSTAVLLELFRAQRGHLAILVDAYNRTFGLVTREDVFLHLSGGKGDRA